MYRVPSSERRFYGGMILSLAAVVFIGFAPSFYLRSMLGSGRPLAPLLIAHGVVFSTWLLLLAAQSALITSHRQDLHRKLGGLGIAVAPAMVVLGFATALTLAARLVRTQGAIAAGHAALAMLDLPARLQSFLTKPLRRFCGTLKDGPIG